MENLYVRFYVTAFIKKKKYQRTVNQTGKNEVLVAFLQGRRYSLHPISRPLPGYIPNVLPGFFSYEDSEFLQTRTNPHVRHVNSPGSTFTRVED